MVFAEQMMEAIRICRAAERVSAMAEPIRSALRIVDGALEVAPELDPELGEVKNRLLEITNHLVAANAVLTAKMEFLSDRV